MSVQGNEAAPHITGPVPGPEARKVVRLDHKHLVTTTKTAPIAARQARGCVVEDLDGNLFLDFAAGIGVLNTGHCHPEVVRAVQDQVARLMHFAGTDFYYPQQAELARELGRRVPVTGAAKAFFCQSGTEANEASIKLAKAATGRNRVIAFMGAFHGRSHGSLGLTASKAVHRKAFFGFLPGVHHVPFPNPYRNPWGIDGYAEPEELANRAIDFLAASLDAVSPASDTAAVFWEPVQGEGGYVVPPKMFPRMLRALCDEHGILLVADEVQTGFGRTGRWFGSEHFGVDSDIVSLAKAMGSGFPIGASVCRAALDFEERGMHSSTYGGNVAGCAAALATIRVLEDEDLVGNSARMGAHMGARLQELADAHASIGDHRGLGLMRALEFVAPDGSPDPKLRSAVEEAAWKRGLILLGCGKSSLRFIPPLTVSEAQVDGAMQVLAEALKAAKA